MTLLGVVSWDSLEWCQLRMREGHDVDFLDDYDAGGGIVMAVAPHNS
jgi:hypothetical protein